MSTGFQPPQALGHIELQIGGMTCASCAARIEKKLNRLDGVTATVNYATEKAHGHRPRRPGRRTTLIAAVEQTGYTATLPDRAPSDDRDEAGGPAAASADRELAGLRQRLIMSRGADGAGDRAGDGAGLAVHLLAVAVADPGRAGGRVGRRGRSTGPPGPTCGTAPPPWTP